MTRLLALETSGSACSVAVHVDGVWFENIQNVERQHNQVLLAQIDALLTEAGIAPRGIEVIAFAAGPGSFTGIRLAAAAAQALAFASDARIVPVSSSEALALAARSHAALSQGEQPLPDEAPLLTITRSRRDAYYVACWEQLTATRPRCLLNDELYQGEHAALPLACRGFAGVGDLPPWWKSGGGGRWVSGVTVGARTVGEIGLRQHAAGESVDPALGLPIYVVGDTPWKPMPQDAR